jgi:hypothetical protein
VTVAALFVAAGGCYFGLPDVDPWDVTRDARLYAGRVSGCPCCDHGHHLIAIGDSETDALERAVEWARREVPRAAG